MITLLTDQKASDRYFRQWVDGIVGGSEQTVSGWVIPGAGVAFSNYGHGEPGEITNQVMLGVEKGMPNGIVKIVQPETAQQDKGKLTAIGQDDHGTVVLLRQGWLKKNGISDGVREGFAKLSGLDAVAVSADGKRSARDWYVVAELNADPAATVDATAEFARACAMARSKMGKAEGPGNVPDSGYTLGMDEKGRLTKVVIQGGTREVEELHGFVWNALKTELGDRLIKPTRSRYEVDGFIEAAGLLIEIKTGLAAHDVYEGVGQLALYPHLVALPADVTSVLLLPDTPTLRPAMAAAVIANSILIHYYSVGRLGDEPVIHFGKGFLELCYRNSGLAGS